MVYGLLSLIYHIFGPKYSRAQNLYLNFVVNKPQFLRKFLWFYTYHVTNFIWLIKLINHNKIVDPRSILTTILIQQLCSIDVVC